MTAAVDRGHWAQLDDVDAAAGQVIERLNPLLEKPAIWRVIGRSSTAIGTASSGGGPVDAEDGNGNKGNDTGGQGIPAEMVRPHPWFRVVATQSIAQGGGSGRSG